MIEVETTDKMIKDRSETELNEIIEQKTIKSVFQPIISLADSKILGYEALSRITVESVISNTEQLFCLAERYNRIWDLEQLCRVKSLESAFLQMDDKSVTKLFLNVNPKIMNDISFQNGFTKEYLQKFKIAPDKIVFEITEREAINNMESFQKVIEHYKNQQYRIAIDDAGAGYSGLNLISDIHPHYLKLDMKLIRNVNTDELKQALIKGMVEFSKIANIKLIAEGIETRDEMRTLIDLGVQYGQGYYIQVPHERMQEINSRIVSEVIEWNQFRRQLNGGKLANIPISSICKVTDMILPERKVEEVFDIFKKNAELNGMCVVSKDRVLGIVIRDNFILRLSGRYGFSLYQKKEITSVMDNEYLEVDYQTPISTVSYLAMERENKKLYDMIVVTKHGKYYGTVTVKDLLQKATEIDIANAKNQNPLTGLSGNELIEHEMEQILKTDCQYSILYLDIDNFKAYNDVYGFENGDKVIKLLANIIVSQVGESDFVGHIGGDDFLVILYDYNWKHLCNNIINLFIMETRKLYTEQDMKTGFIVTTNRSGDLEEFPLLTLTIAIVTNRKTIFKNKYELTEELARLKKKGKQLKGCVYYIDEPCF